ncbi:MAG TPA: MarR family transcriptional regulator [Candidatus Limnocylindrales bacterium]
MKHSATSSASVNALERIVVASVAITARALSDVAPELTLVQWRVLVLIDRPGGLTVGAIAAELESKIAAVSRLLGRLRSRGLIDTRRDLTDARLVYVSLTDAGMDLRTRVLDRRRDDLLAALDQGHLPANAPQTIEGLAGVLETVA